MRGIYAIKPWFQRSLGGAEDWLVARRVHPDVLTIGAVGVSVLGAVAIAASSYVPLLLVVVPVVTVGRTALNALDGLVARRLGLARPWGEVLNEVCDRVADILLIGSLLLVPGIPTLLGALTLVAMFMTSYIGIVGKAAGGRRQYGGIMGKADRMMLLGGSAVLALALGTAPVFSIVLWLILVGSLVTAVQRLRTIGRELAETPARQT